MTVADIHFSTEKRDLLLDILCNPSRERLQNAYSAWLRARGEKPQADFVDTMYRMVKMCEVMKPAQYKTGKRQFHKEVTEVLGLASYHIADIDVEGLLEGGDALVLRRADYDGQALPHDFTAINTVIRAIEKNAGVEVMVSLAASVSPDLNNPDTDLLYRYALDHLDEVSLSKKRKGEIAETVYAKTAHYSSGRHAEAARAVEHYTGKTPDDSGEKPEWKDRKPKPAASQVHHALPKGPIVVGPWHRGQA